MTNDRLDFHLDNILKAAGSALKHYSMQKSKDDMRQALRQALEDLNKGPSLKEVIEGVPYFGQYSEKRD